MFESRADAGRKLAKIAWKLKPVNPVVLGIARCGVEMAFEVSSAIKAPLDVVVTKKISAPSQPETVLGAVAEGDDLDAVFTREAMECFEFPADLAKRRIIRQSEEIRLQSEIYRSGHPKVSIRDSTVFLVDDGIVTGASIQAAIRQVRRERIRSLVLCSAVVPGWILESLANDVDELICLESPNELDQVKDLFRDSRPPSDETIVKLLRLSKTRRSPPPGRLRF